MREHSTPDLYEQEAEAMAARIVSATPSMTDGSAAGTAVIRRLGTGTDPAGTTVDGQLDRGGGRPLSSATRTFMEPRFGVDFGSIRVHDDANAQVLAGRLQARAFTQGADIWLGKEGSESDRSLMAHELTHVVQQDRGTQPGVVQRQPACGTSTTPRSFDVYLISLPGSTRDPNADVTRANTIWAQCDIGLNVVAGESWATNLLDLEAPTGVLNAPSGTIRPLTSEENVMVAHKPGGDGAIHIYFVPSFSGPKVGEAFWPSQHGQRVVVVADGARVDTFAHEVGHVLLDSGDHRDGDPDNLMASGSVRNAGVDKLACDQCR